MADSAHSFSDSTPWSVTGPQELEPQVARTDWWRGGPGPILRSMVLVAVCAMLLLGAGVAASVAYTMRKAAAEEALPAQTRALEYAGRTLAFRVEQQQKPLLALAHVLAEHMHESREAVEALLLQPASIAQQFEQIQLADGKGQLLVHLNNGQPRPLPQLADQSRDVLKRALAEGKPVTQAWVRSGEAGLQLEFQNAVPVRNAQGKFLGVLGANYKAALSVLLPLDDSAGSTSGQILLMDREARPLAMADKGQWQIPAAGDAALPRGLDLAWFKQIHAGAGGLQRDGQLWSAVPLPMTQWVLVKVSKAHKWVEGLTTNMLGWLVLVLTVAAITLGAVLCLIAYPMTALYRKAQRAQQRGVVTEADASVYGAHWWQRLSSHDWGEAQTLRVALQALGRCREGHGERERQLQLQLQTLMDYAPVGLVVTQSDTVQRVGMHAARVLGYQPREMQGLPVRMLCASEQEFQGLMDRITRALDVYGQFDSEVCLVRKDARPIWVRIHGQSIRRMSRAWEQSGKDTDDRYQVWELEDVTTKRLVREQSSWKAMHDPLTRLPNRAAFELRLKEWLAECQASLRESATGDAAVAASSPAMLGVILYVDLDHFSQVNRQSGREVGDEVLGHIARLIENSTRPHGWVARVGGDEFAVLLPGLGREEGMRHAQLVCMAIQDWDGSHQGQRYMLSASIGMLLLDASYQSVDTAFKDADMACYAAKRKGRNRVEVMAASAESITNR